MCGTLLKGLKRLSIKYLLCHHVVMCNVPRLPHTHYPDKEVEDFPKPVEPLPVTCPFLYFRKLLFLSVSLPLCLSLSLSLLVQHVSNSYSESQVSLLSPSSPVEKCDSGARKEKLAAAEGS